jgi:DNA-binding transcriptional LysR family regulator
VTHGAVSRQIKVLEETMGVSLLSRGIKESAPTAEGEQLAEGLIAAFSLVYATIERLKPGPLTLSCSSSITMCWLIPRMPSFYAKHPALEIKLDMNYDRVDFTRDNISVAIRNSTIDPPKSAIIRPLGTVLAGSRNGLVTAYAQESSANHPTQSDYSDNGVPQTASDFLP